MAVDRQLVQRIKSHFARKSLAQLKHITVTGENDQWSAEAIVAAGEIVMDREAGRAVEPAECEEDSPPPSPSHTIDNLALMVGLNAFTMPFGVIILPLNRPYEDDPLARDIPLPFGPGVAWLALDTKDTTAVVAALGLRAAQVAPWAEGIPAAHQSSVFVTPPVGDWTLVVSATLFPPHDRTSEFVKSFLERLSQQFRDAQYFCTQKATGLHIWGRARKGRLIRGYGWLGKESITLWNEGALTREERVLGLKLPGGQGSAENQVLPPEEGDVLQLANYWSIDPNTLDEQFKEPVMGVLGKPGWPVAKPL